LFWDIRDESLWAMRPIAYNIPYTFTKKKVAQLKLKTNTEEKTDDELQVSTKIYRVYTRLLVTGFLR
jgi:hypothetical protein